MKAADLAIRDWLFYYDEDECQNIPVKIVSIDDDGWVFYEFPDGTRQEGWCKNLYPIPLTPEILEKNGFECRGAWCLPGEDFGLRQDGDSLGLLSYYAEYDALPFCHIKYIHELQHALRLCGIDKEIEL